VEGLGAEYRGDSGSERSSHSIFFAKMTPMNDSRSTNITNLSISNLVNSHFLDKRWFDFHFLDNDFLFLNNRYGQARLRMHFLDNAFCALMSIRPKLKQRPHHEGRGTRRRWRKRHHAQAHPLSEQGACRRFCRRSSARHTNPPVLAWMASLKRIGNTSKIKLVRSEADID
jgi:hypothetical protein